GPSSGGPSKLGPYIFGAVGWDFLGRIRRGRAGRLLFRISAGLRRRWPFDTLPRLSAILARFFASVWRRGGCSRLGLPARASVVDAQNRLSDFDFVPSLDLDVGHLARHRRWHLNGGLVGLELENRLILVQRVPGLHQDAQHISGGDVFSQLRECEVGHHDTAGLSFSGFTLCALMAWSTIPRSILPSRASAASAAITTKR